MDFKREEEEATVTSKKETARSKQKAKIKCQIGNTETEELDVSTSEIISSSDIFRKKKDGHQT